MLSMSGVKSNYILHVFESCLGADPYSSPSVCYLGLCKHSNMSINIDGCQINSNVDDAPVLYIVLH